MNYRMDNVRKKNEEELKKELFKNSDQLRKMRFDAGDNQLKNVKEMGVVKREIARILTNLKERKKNGI